MPTPGNMDILKHPSEDDSASRLVQKRSSRRRFWFLLALIGAIVVVSLYLLVPLVIFFGVVRDLLTQLLGALLVFTIVEFVIVSILLKTVSSMKPISAKMRTALLKSKKTDNVPFDIIVDSSTVGVPISRPQDRPVTESRKQRKRRRSVPVQQPEFLSPHETPQHLVGEE